MKKIEKVNMFINFERKEAEEYAEAVAKEFQKELQTVEQGLYPSEAQLVIVVGGDGTMLEAKEKYWMYGAPLLGLNFGYKGFLMNDPKDPAEAVSRIVEGRFRVCFFPLLRIETDAGKTFAAMNDIYFNRIGGRSCKLNVKVNGVEVAERVTGDGFIVSTALGSTGYNFAAGGPAIYPELPVIALTPISIHAPIQLRPMVFPLKSRVEIEVLNLRQDEIKGWYDGFDLPPFKKIRIVGGEQRIKLGFWEEENFTERLISKIMKVQEGRR